MVLRKPKPEMATSVIIAREDIFYFYPLNFF